MGHQKHPKRNAISGAHGAWNHPNDIHNTRYNIKHQCNSETILNTQQKSQRTKENMRRQRILAAAIISSPYTTFRRTNDNESVIACLEDGSRTHQRVFFILWI